MVWLRNVLMMGVAIVGYLLVLAWQSDMALVRSSPVGGASSHETRLLEGEGHSQYNADAPTPSQDVPTFSRDEMAATTGFAPDDASNEESTVVTVETELAIVKIDLQGGDVVGVQLREYPQTLEEGSSPFLLMDRSSELYYVAQSGFAGTNGLDSKGRPLYTLEPGALTMSAGQPELAVTLRAVSEDGVVHRKQFVFKKDHYDINVRFSVDNQSQENWAGTVFNQIKRNDAPDVSDTSVGQYTFLGGAYYDGPDDPYNKLELDEICTGTDCLHKTIEGGWIAMIQHYFMAAWVPQPEIKYDYETAYVDKQFRILRLQTTQRLVKPGDSTAWNMTFYAGPKIKSDLKVLAPGLELAVDYGPLFFLSEFFFDILSILTDGVGGWTGLGNWGLAILVMTLLIKATLWPLSAKAYRSMAQMRKLQPRIARLKEQFGDDRQQMSQKMMELYKTERINPLGGCLPMLIQMPIFLAFYWMLLESVELRQAPFLGWIQDLSVRDPYFVLPILMGATMYLQQLLSPMPPDPMQAKVMRIMPIGMTALFMFFPAGVVLYWCCSNLVSITQQWYITRMVEAKEKAT